MTSKTKAKKTILFVDDDQKSLKYFAALIRKNGYEVDTAENGRDALLKIRRNPPDLLIIDLLMPVMDGFETIKEIKQDDSIPYFPVIILSVLNNSLDIKKGLELGAEGYISKPMELNSLLSLVQGLIRLNKSVQEFKSKGEMTEVPPKRLYQYNGSPLKYPSAFSSFITQSPKMFSIFKIAERLAKPGNDTPILITGETGVGKNLLAEAIHCISQREGGLLQVNIAGIPDTALDSTLSGQARRRFADGKQHRKGLNENASHGTLFIDEIGDLSLAAQLKILELLDGSFYSRKPGKALKSPARLILSTNRKPELLIPEGQIRQDFFLRLNVQKIEIPPLRERMEDIPLLVDFFMNKTAIKLGVKPLYVPNAVFDLLYSHNFRGNVRELENLIFHSVSLHESNMLSVDSVWRALDTVQRTQMESKQSGAALLEFLRNPLDYNGPFPRLLKTKRILYREALRRAKGNQKEAAKLLGISHSNMLRLCEEVEEEEEEENGDFFV